MKTLVIIRGNSGSGKTTISRKLDGIFAGQSVLIELDHVRRDMFQEKVHEQKHKIFLLQEIRRNFLLTDLVIFDGLLKKENYESLVNTLRDEYNTVHVYMDIPFEETVRRHGTREKSKEFGVEKLTSWYLPEDDFGFENTTVLNKNHTLKESVEILSNVIKKNLSV